MPAPHPRGGRGGPAFGSGRSSTDAALDAILSEGSTAPQQQQAGRGLGKGRGRGRGNATSSVSTTSGVGALQALRNGTLQRGSTPKNVSRGSPVAGKGSSRAMTSQPNAFTNPQFQSNFTASSTSNTTTPSQFRPKSQSPPSFAGVSRGRSASPMGGAGQTRGRGYMSQTFNNRKQPSSTPGSRITTPQPQSQDYMSQVRARYESLKQAREKERAKAIEDGMLADPDKKRTLDQAITPSGTCTEMCPEFERLERIVQNMVDKSEKVDMLDGTILPSEVQMVKRFRRSAAGYDEQLPSDIRTPDTLRSTLDYLIDQVVDGPERLAVVHKFVWDRTRAIRNDFSIQQLTKEEDVKIAVECYERIARFHIYSLHHFSNPDNLAEGEDFNAFQEREQLQKTLLSLLYYYNDNAGTMQFPNEAEFRAYCIVRELQTLTPDIEDQLQTLPPAILQSRRVQTALNLYNTAGNTLQDQGPLQPFIPFALAQNRFGSFWSFLAGPAISYTMACVAETYFPPVRFAALDALWKSVKKAPVAQQAKTKDWTLDVVTFFLGFDRDEQTIDFCSAFGLAFAEDERAHQYLDFTARDEAYLDKSQVPSTQIFSQQYVEEKRCNRDLASIINGVSAADAVRSHSVSPVDDEGVVGSSFPDQADEEPVTTSLENESSIFFPEGRQSSFGDTNQTQKRSTSFQFNPAASPFSFSDNGAKSGLSFASSSGSAQEAQPLKSPAFGEGKFSTPGSTQSIFSQGIFAKNDQSSTTPFSDKGVFSEKQKTNTAQDFTFDNWQKQKTATPDANATPPSVFKTPLQPSSSTSQIEVQQKPVFNFGGGTPANAEPEQKPFAGFSFTKPAPTESAIASNKTPTERPTSGLSAAPSPASIPFTFPSFTSPKIPTSQPSIPAAQQTLPPVSQQPRLFDFTRTQPQPKTSTTPADLFPFSQTPDPTTTPKSPSPKIQTPLPAFPPSNSTVNPPATSLPPAASSPIFPTNPSLPAPPAVVDTRPQPARSTTPPLQPTQPAIPPKPKFNRNEIIDNAARLAVAQKSGGLMLEFVQFSLGSTLQKIFQQHAKEVYEGTLLRLKNNFLMRKYFPLWRQFAWRKYLNRKAKTRRQAFAESLRMETEKKRRREEELEDIIKATKESRRLQADIMKSKEVKLKQKAEENEITNTKSSELQLAGTKRKSLGREGVKETAEAGPSMVNHTHKRSRTMSPSMPPPPRPSHHSPPTNSSGRRSIFKPGASVTSLNRSRSAREMNASQFQLRPKIDETKTDFFRLLAHGMDPNTPLIPLTASQIRERAQREKSEKNAALERAYNRRRVGSTRTSSTPEQTSPALEQHRITPSPSPAPSVASSLTPEQEDLIRELQAAREAMADDAEWFKAQTAAFGEEIEETGKSKTSSNNQQKYRISSKGSPVASRFDLRAPSEQKASSLSRTEQLIRARGPRTLAYKPIANHKSDYLPVAMSKRSALRISQNSEDVQDPDTNGPTRRKKKHTEVDRTYRPSKHDREEDEDDELEHEQLKPPKSTKHARLSSATKVSQQPIPYSNPYEHLQEALEEDEELLEEEDESDDQPSEEYYRNGVDADVEEDEEDEETGEELEESEDDGSDEEEELIDGVYHPKYLRPQSQPYDDAPTPGTQKSAASSGPGATEEDAIELSD